MSLSPHFADDLSIFNSSEIPRELLNSPSNGEQYLLVVGPNLVKQKEIYSHRQKYLGWLLEEIVAWCIQNNVIQQQDLIDELRTLLADGALIRASYKIEEYLAAPYKQHCLQAVFQPHNQVKAIHYQLARIPFRGYITTGYDTCIETAYTEIWHNQLRKFYHTSTSKAIDACHSKEPFILKLFGDLDNTNAIRLGHRLFTGLYAESDREQLRQLFLTAPALFIGFDNEDQDLAILKSLVKNDSIHCHTCAGPIIKQENGNGLPGSNGLTSSPTISHLAMLSTELLATVRPRRGSNSGRNNGNAPAPSRSPQDKQDAQNENQPRTPIKVFTFYASEDYAYEEQLKNIFDGYLIKEGRTFDIDYLSASISESLGYVTDEENPLMSSKLVILLISRPFLGFIGSSTQHRELMQRVVTRHPANAWICPLLVRPCNWKGTLFDGLKPNPILPSDKKMGNTPVSSWPSPDEAYENISEKLEWVLGQLASSSCSA